LTLGRLVDMVREESLNCVTKKIKLINKGSLVD
jgi:hypothetical protein